MAVEKVGEKYRCDVCGNEVIVTKVGGGELVCCGQPMEKIENIERNRIKIGEKYIPIGETYRKQFLDIKPSI